MGIYFKENIRYKIELLVNFILAPRYWLSIRSQLQPQTLDLQETGEPSPKPLFKMSLRSVEFQMNFMFVAQNDRKRT